MSMRRHDNGGLYGTVPVLLSRELANGEIEVLVGSQPPFGGITVTEFRGNRFVEEHDEYWLGHGFTITVPPILEEARRLGRARRVSASSVGSTPEGQKEAAENG